MERQSRTPLNLSQSSQRRLTSYALAAGAAGVGVLALATPSQAEIVYTATEVKIRAVLGDNLGHAYQLDLNGDGVIDFQLANETFGNVGGQVLTPAVRGNHVVGAGIYASALAAGANIGPGVVFAHPGHHVATSMARWIRSSGINSSFGPWKNTRNHYLGFRFLINGENHYGWARISIQTDDMLLTGYAYETVANKAIVAGQESSADDAANTAPTDPSASSKAAATLGRLAQGAAGLVAWRRELA